MKCRTRMKVKSASSPPEEAEAVLRAVAELILPFLQEAADERGTEHEGV